MDPMTERTESPDETRRLAQTWSTDWKTGHTLALVGELGTGKTTFLRGLVEVLGGSSGDVRSPTYTLLNLYDGTDPPVAHADLYRVAGPEDQETIGLEEYFGRRLVVVEWAERWTGRWPEPTETIRFSHVDPGVRRVVRSPGPPDPGDPVTPGDRVSPEGIPS